MGRNRLRFHVTAPHETTEKFTGWNDGLNRFRYIQKQARTTLTTGNREQAHGMSVLELDVESEEAGLGTGELVTGHLDGSSTRAMKFRAQRTIEVAERANAVRPIGQFHHWPVNLGTNSIQIYAAGQLVAMG